MRLLTPESNGYDVQIIQHEGSRFAEYRKRRGDNYREKNAARMRKSRAASVPEFIGVDGEGVGRGKDHKYVLLSVGNQSLIEPRGIVWQQAYEFFYDQFQGHPRSAFTGFYLGYDFNVGIFPSLPLNTAYMLLNPKGRAMRKKPEVKGRSGYFPVRCDGWEFDIMGMKRLSIRPIAPGCRCAEKLVKCPLERHLPYFHLCDAGAFYQMSFLKVLEKWTHMDTTVCTEDEYQQILRGKARRESHELDDEMIAYNVLENELLARVMKRLALGFNEVGIRLAKDQWYGPGAAAAKWLSKRDVPKHDSLVKKGERLIPKWFWDACRRSYFGGWFEIFSHGIIKGESFNYDINNAYPFAATKLPHICGECDYKRGQGDYTGAGEHVLMFCTVFAKGNRIGPVPYRDKTGSILRPSAAKGWYWKFELDAAKRAGLVKKVMVNEWMEFIPCSHPNPLTELQVLYDLRISVGKDSAQGWAIKLNNNSVYGKFAQDVGAAPYNNWFYSSYITAHCRTAILQAIATHPGGDASVLMVATDGICFDSPHPTLPISKKLGEWDATTYTDLCLFKPGVYWHKKGKEQLLQIKSRGVPRDEFAAAIEQMEGWFNELEENSLLPGDTLEEWQVGDDALIGTRLVWPRFQVPIKFRVRSCKQALNEGNWPGAGEVMESIMVTQDSDPSAKRTKPTGGRNGRIDTHIRDVPIKELETCYHKEVAIRRGPDLGIGYDNNASDAILQALAAARDKPPNYDLPTGEVEWVQVW